MIQDVGIIIALCNFFSMVGNLWASLKLSSIRSNHELVSYWKEECVMKEDKIKKLEGRLRMYQNVHNHKPLAYHNTKGVK